MSIEQASGLPELDSQSFLDLPTLACEAAIELDNMLLNRFTGVESVRMLADKISQAIPDIRDPASPNWLSNPDCGRGSEPSYWRREADPASRNGRRTNHEGGRTRRTTQSGGGKLAKRKRHG